MTMNVSKIEVRSFVSLTILLYSLNSYGYSITEISKEKVVVEVPTNAFVFSKQAVSMNDDKLRMAIMALSSPENREEVKKEINSFSGFNEKSIETSINRSKRLNIVLDVCTRGGCSAG